MMFGNGLLGWSVSMAVVMILVAMALAFIRLVRGPSLADRVVALDLITVLAVSFAALIALAFDERAFLDVALALALVAFLATVAFARYVEQSRRDDGSAGDDDAPRGVEQ